MKRASFPVKRLGYCLLIWSAIGVSCNKTPPAAPTPTTLPTSPTLTKTSVSTLGAPDVQRPSIDIEATRKSKQDDQQTQLDQVEAPLLKKVDEEWDKVLNLVHETARKSIDPRVLPETPAAQTEQQFRRQVYDLRIREVSSYRELTQDPPEVRDAAQRFLEAYIAEATGQPRENSEKTVTELGEVVIKAGSNDPFVRLHAAMQIASDDSDAKIEEVLQAYRTLKEVYPQLISLKYPEYPTYQCKYFEWKLARRVSTFEQTRLLPEVQMALANWLTVASRDPDNLSVTWKRLSGFSAEWDIERLREYYLAILKKPEIDPWLVHMLGAHFHQRLGWHYRGGGFADTVSKEGWDKLAVNQSLAVRHVLYAWYRRPTIADAPIQMQNIALTNHEFGSSRDWFLRAIALRIDAWEPYHQLDWSLRPRWGGSIEECVTLAKACLKSARFDTEVPGYGLELLLRLQDQELGSKGSIFDDSSLHDVLVAFGKALDQAAEDAPPGMVIPSDTSYRRSTLAALLLLSGDLDGARAALLPVGYQIHTEPFDRIDVGSVYEIGQLLAFTPELGEPLNRIKQTIREGVKADTTPEFFDGALADLATVRKAHALPEGIVPLGQAESDAAAKDPALGRLAWIRLFVNNAEAALQRMKNYASGGWVDLTVDESLSGWEVDSSSWKANPPDAIDITGDKSRPRYLLKSLARFEPPYDVRVTVRDWADLISTNVPNVGIALGSSQTSFLERTTGMRQFGIHPGSGSAAIWRVGANQTPAHQKIPGQYGTPADIRVKVWPGGHYSFLVNNFRISETTEPDFYPGQDLTFGTGTPSGYEQYAGGIKLAKMRIRKLNYPPVSKEAGPQTREKQARQALEFDPDDASAYYDLGTSLVAQKKYGPALAALERVEQLQLFYQNQDLFFFKALCQAYSGEHEAALDGFRSQQSRLDKYSGERINQMNFEMARIRAIAPDEHVRSGGHAMRLISALNEATKFANWDYLWVLAATHAELGEFEPASKRIRESRVLAPEDQKEFLGKLEKLFDSKKPYRDQTKPTAKKAKST